MGAFRPRGGGRDGSVVGGGPPGLLLVALLLTGPAAVPAGAQTGEEARLAADPIVAEIRWEGNEVFDDDVLQAAIATRETRCRSLIARPLCLLGVDLGYDPGYFDAREFERDRVRVRLFYYQRGYRDATVDTAVSRRNGSVELTFRIEEREPVVIDSVAVVDEEDVLSPGIARRLPLRAGRPFSLLALEASRDTLRALLRNRGYARADVLNGYTIPSDAPHSARVTFTLIPGPRARFGELSISGNEKVATSVVRRMLPFEPGDLYSDRAVRDAQRGLFGLEIFRHAAVEPDFGADPDTLVPVRVQVNEGQVHRVRTGAGMSTADCVSAEARWTSRNFYGGARRLQLTGRVSNVLAPDLESLCPEAGSAEFTELDWLVSADFSQPWVFSSKNSLSASVFAERQSIPDIFIRKAFGGNLGLTRSVGRRTNLTLSYRPAIQELDAAEVFFCTSFLVCDPGDIDELQAPNWLAPLGVELARDRTDDPLEPTRGYTAVLSLEHASALTGSDFEYNRAVAELTGYLDMGDDWILAARVRPGWVEPRPFGGLSEEAVDISVVHPQKRFYAGGASSVRGFAQNQLGPRVLTTDVENLVREGTGPGAVCAPQEVNDLSCDPDPLAEGFFSARPLGGSTALEGSLELRFPLGIGDLRGAAFLDVGEVWPEADEVSLRGVEVSPGMGVRFRSPVGPIRIDVGFRPRGIERLQVVTQKLRPFDPARGDTEGQIVVTSGGTGWVVSDELALLEPTASFGSSDDSFFQRLQLHFSIGEAF